MQYNVWLSCNCMAALRLNPLPATPFSGRGMIGRPVGWAVEAFRKASFSAERVTEVSAEVYEVFGLLTLQFFKLGGILHAQPFICLQLHEKNKCAIKILTIFLGRISIFICSSSTSDVLPPNRKNIYLSQHTSWCFAVWFFLLWPSIRQQLSWLEDQSWEERM